jgi:hypothetical protein
MGRDFLQRFEKQAYQVIEAGLEPVIEIVLFPPNSYQLIPSFSSSKLPNAIGAVLITISLQVAQASHLASS